MLNSENKKNIIKKHQIHEKDTGSICVQIGLINEQIKRLILHSKSFPKDFHSKRGLIKMVAKRKKFLNLLKKEDEEKYHNLIKELELKK